MVEVYALPYGENVSKMLELYSISTLHIGLL